MTTSARLCASCGSPLPEVAPDVRQVKCAFCAVVNDIAVPSATRSIKVAVDSAGATRVVRRLLAVIVGIVLISVAVPLAMAGFGMYVAWRSVSNSVPGTEIDTKAAASALRSLANADSPKSIAPADLARAGGAGWKTLEVTPPSSGWATFEPVADLPWAMSIARAWQPDARLTRIDVSRLTPPGTVNLTGSEDDSAGYRFESPAQIEAWRNSARGGDSSPRAGHELMVKLSQQKVTALVVSGKPLAEKLPPASIDSLPLSQLMSAARRKPAFAQPSFFDGYMIYNEREGWVWYLTGRGFDESLPRLRARDGAPYPFR